MTTLAFAVLFSMQVVHFPSYDRQENAEDREQDGEDEQSARGLQVRGQGEQ